MFLSVLIGGLVLGCTYGILGLGYSLIYQASGYMNFTQPNLLMFGAFIGLTLFGSAGLPYVMALFLAMIVMAAFGIVMERGVIHVMIHKNSKNIYIVLATIALATIIENAAMLIWDTRQHVFPNVFHAGPLKIGSASVSYESLLAIALSVVAMLAVHFFLNRTKFGTGMRAAAQSKLAARAMGINVGLTVSVTYGIAAALACLGGILVAPALTVSMNLGSQLGTKGFAAAVVGGYGHIYGAIVGGILLGLLETFVAYYISSAFKDFIVYAVMMVMIVLKPTGLFNAKVYAT